MHFNSNIIKRQGGFTFSQNPLEIQMKTLGSWFGSTWFHLVPRVAATGSARVARGHTDLQIAAIRGREGFRLLPSEKAMFVHMCSYMPATLRLLEKSVKANCRKDCTVFPVINFTDFICFLGVPRGTGRMPAARDRFLYIVEFVGTPVQYPQVPTSNESTQFGINTSKCQTAHCCMRCFRICV